MNDYEELAKYLELTVAALVKRCGGEVTITPEELYDASCRPASWQQVDENYRIMIGAKR